jgi:outer membrane protein OmpA-like peptidoglycan-associated protein
MVTLLLTFFVMLLSMANYQDPELFHKGRDSFLEAIRGLGLGMLYGRRDRPEFGKVKVKYFISNPDELFEGRTIDAKEEEIRRIFKEVSRSTTTMPSQIVAQTTNFSVTNIRFPPGDATLDESAKRYLTDFCLDLQQDTNQAGIKLYVLGLARDVKSEKEQWILSAERAGAIAAFVRSILPSEPKWPVYSWGAGPGGDWVDKKSPISKESQILIAVLRGEE